MIAWLNQNGENVPLKDYTYDAGNEPTWYGSPKDATTFDTYMTNLLAENNFPVPSVPKPGVPNSSISNTSSLEAQSFDQAFFNFIEGTDQPDKYSTRAWLMLGPPGPQWTYSQTEVAETADT